MAASLNELAAVEAKAAITMVVPTERVGENRAFDSHLTRMLAEAREQTAAFASKRVAKQLVRSVRDRTDALDRAHLSKGLWIGAHDDEVIMHRLDDEVTPQVSVGHTLNLLPLVRQSRRSNALVLLLTEAGCRLIGYHSGGALLHDRLHTLKVRGMPARFHGEGARKGRESEGDQINDRYRQWMRKVARITSKAYRRFPALASVPLIVVGVDRYIGYFTEVSSDLGIASVIHGSPDAFTLTELDQRIASQVDRLRNDAAIAALSRVAQALGAGRTSVDPAETLRWAEMGRIDTLVVEEGVESAEVVRIALQVYSRAGTVLSAPDAAVATHVAALAPSRWVALLRW